MKKCLITATILASLAGCAFAETTVSSANIVGYVQISVPSNSYYLGAFNFEAGETNYFNDVFGTNQLVSSSRRSNCETVYLWDMVNQQYNQYAQYNGQTYSTDDWQGTPVNPEITGGFFIKSASDTNHVITLSGDVVTDSVLPITIVGGDAYTMICYPFSCDIAISNLNIEGATSSSRRNNADLIYTWETDHYEQYGLYTDGNWYNVDEWAENPTTNTINLSQGFWYKAQNPITWSATNIYYNSINNN
jgi:hypothetical protein